MKKLLIYIPLSLALLLYLNTAVIGQNNYDYPDGHSFTIGDSLVEIELNWDDPEEAIVVFSVATKTEQAVSFLHPKDGIYVQMFGNMEACSNISLFVNGLYGRGGCRLEAPFPLLHLRGNSKHSFQILNPKLVTGLKNAQEKYIDIKMGYVLADIDGGLSEIEEFSFFREARQLIGGFFFGKDQPCAARHEAALNFIGYLNELQTPEN